MSLHYNVDNSYLFVNGKEIFKFKTDNKNVNFPTQFCIGRISNGFSAAESRKVYLYENVYEYKTISSLIKQVFTVLLSFSNSLVCLDLLRPTVTDLNPVELIYYPFMINLDKCNGTCNVLSPKICV